MVGLLYVIGGDWAVCGAAACVAGVVVCEERAADTHFLLRRQHCPFWMR
jgi:hypothetical protein